MFTYRLWFKSGNDIEGVMDAINAKELKTLFLHRRVNPGPWELRDTDGEVIIDISEVEALSIIPKEQEPPPAGFKAVVE